MISVFYKGFGKEIPPCKHRKRIFWISSNFSQSVLAEYCSYDLHVPGARKVDVGLSPAQFWCQYLKYFSRRVDLNFLFSLNPLLGISAFIPYQQFFGRAAAFGLIFVLSSEIQSEG